MTNFFDDPSHLLIVAGCLSAVFIAFLILCACVFLMRRKTRHKLKKDQQPTLELENLFFVYDTHVEKQQSSVSTISYPNSSPSKHSSKTTTSHLFRSIDDQMLISQSRSADSSSNDLRRAVSDIDISSSQLVPISPIDASNGLVSSKTIIDPSNLDLSLYKEEEVAPSSPFVSTGKLSLSLNYKKSSEQLTVKILKGVNIQAKQANSVASPYLKICLLPDKKRRQHSKTRKGERPLFNETFSFSVPPHNLESRVLRIAMCDFDRFSRQNVLGYVVISLKEEMESLMSEEGTGKLWKVLQDTDTLPGQNKGELLLSLAHLPTAGRLTLSVVKGKDLHVNLNKDSGVAVKVYLILNGKAVKSKKSVIHKTELSNPSFNESFVFDACEIERTSFVVTAFAYCGNGKRVIGKTNTGPYMYSTGIGLSHWNEMLAQPRSTVSKWHLLV